MINRLLDARTLYFACSGNTCRSPMAARVMIEELKAFQEIRMDVRSRKAAVVRERPKTRPSLQSSSLAEPISEGAREVILQAYGDCRYVRRHRAKPFTPEELELADVVVTMTPMHMDQLARLPEAFTPGGLLKVYSFGVLLGRPQLSVQDPIGKDVALMRNAYEGEVRAKPLQPHPHRSLLASLLDRTIPQTPMNDQNHLPQPSPARMVPEEVLERHFSTEQLRQFRIEGYLPTFQQLQNLIPELFKVCPLPAVSMSDVYVREVLAGRAAWRRHREAVFSYGVLPPEDSLGRFRPLEDAYLSAAALLTDFEPIVSEYAAIMETHLAPLDSNILVSQGKVAEIPETEQRLYEHLRRVSLAVPALVRADRYAACAARRIARAGMEIAEWACSDEHVDDLYGLLLR